MRRRNRRRSSPAAIKKVKRKHRHSGPVSAATRTRPVASSDLNHKERLQPRTTRRVAFIAPPGTEILDLVGPLQVFARAAEIFSEQNPGPIPIYSIEVISISSQTSVMTNCGLRITAHKTFREVRGEIDTLLVAGGSAIENDEISIEVVRWFRKIAGRVRRLGSVCTGAMLLGRAGLLDGRQSTTHWNWCERLARKYPRTNVHPDPIFVR